MLNYCFPSSTNIALNCFTVEIFIFQIISKKQLENVKTKLLKDHFPFSPAVSLDPVYSMPTSGKQTKWELFEEVTFLNLM